MYFETESTYLSRKLIINEYSLVLKYLIIYYTCMKKNGFEYFFLIKEIVDGKLKIMLLKWLK